MGRRYLASPPQSAEALMQLAAIADQYSADIPHSPCKYLHGDGLMLLTVVDGAAGGSATVVLLSIRHHRQLSFDFARLWPGTTTPDQR